MQNLIATTFEVVHYIALQAVHYKPLQEVHLSRYNHIKWALKVLLPKRIAIEKSSSNTPYIVLSTLSDLRLPIPSKGNQCHMAELMQSLERKLSNQIALKSSYNMLKQYLLRQMFI